MEEEDGKERLHREEGAKGSLRGKTNEGARF